jgi:predicted nucleic acid-binding protein
MTVYAETNAVLRWLFAEPGGDRVRQAFAAARKVVASRLTLIETRRTPRRAERDGRVSAAEVGDLLALLARATTVWAVLEISPDVARRAESDFPIEPVRTLDAIHLASALVLRGSFPDLVVASADERLRANASQLGLRADPLLA